MKKNVQKDFQSIVHDLKGFLYEHEEVPDVYRDVKQARKKIVPSSCSKNENKAHSSVSKPHTNLDDSTVLSKQIDSEWEKVSSKIQECHLCSLSRTRNHVVVGSGDIHSMLYVIGEAPGRDEDIQGAPFVGRSGQLLTKILDSVAIHRDHIYITNIVKCRPPDNRDPKPEEITSCSPYLRQQISFGKPKVILALGRYSAGFLLNDFKSSLGSLRGQFHDSPYGKVLVTYHPSAVLRYPNKYRAPVWEDMKILAKYLDEYGYYNSEQLEILHSRHIF